MTDAPMPRRPDVALAAALYLMTRYQRTPCPVVARAIADHLDCLSRASGIDGCIRSLCVGLQAEWERTAARSRLRSEDEIIH